MPEAEEKFEILLDTDYEHLQAKSSWKLWKFLDRRKQMANPKSSSSYLILCFTHTEETSIVYEPDSLTNEAYSVLGTDRYSTKENTGLDQNVLWRSIIFITVYSINLIAYLRIIYINTPTKTF